MSFEDWYIKKLSPGLTLPSLDRPLLINIPHMSFILHDGGRFDEATDNNDVDDDGDDDGGNDEISDAVWRTNNDNRKGADCATCEAAAE